MTKPKAAAAKVPAKKQSVAERLSAALPPGMGVTPGEGGRVRLELDPNAAPDSYRSIGGTSSRLANMNVVDQVMGFLPPANDLTLAAMRIAGAAKMMEAFAPKDAVEAAIASQATALHLLSMETARRAMLPEQPSDVVSRMRKDAANAARAMVDMTEALERRRGKGPQVIRVEKMLVADGGQAVVGNVTSGAAASGPAASTASLKALEQGAPPMPILEAEPVRAMEGEGVPNADRDA